MISDALRVGEPCSTGTLTVDRSLLLCEMLFNSSNKFTKSSGKGKFISSNKNRAFMSPMFSIEKLRFSELFTPSSILFSKMFVLGGDAGSSRLSSLSVSFILSLGISKFE